jgi:hypothetical protein
MVACGLRHDYGKSLRPAKLMWKLTAQVPLVLEAHSTRMLFIEINQAFSTAESSLHCLNLRTTLRFLWTLFGIMVGSVWRCLTASASVTLS